MSTPEDQLIGAFDDLTAKSAKTRLIAYETIIKNLTQHFMGDFLINRKITVLDSIARCMKKVKRQELGCAASLLSIICATIGPSQETDTIFSELTTQLMGVLADQTMPVEVRVRCAQAISICTYINGIPGYIEQVMDRFYALFSASCAKGDGSMPSFNEATAGFHSTCLLSWTLLLAALDNVSIQAALTMIEERMDKIIELLDSSCLDIKVAAGEALALMCEITRTHNDDPAANDFDDLCDKLRDLVTVTQKFRGKKDLREQRSNFREILATVEKNESPKVIIKFGRERLVLETWSQRRQYDAFCELFGNGINQHLAENEVLRDIFDLGAVVVHLDLPKEKRSDSNYENATASKNRSKSLRKLRDKRADVID